MKTILICTLFLVGCGPRYKIETNGLGEHRVWSKSCLVNSWGIEAEGIKGMDEADSIGQAAVRRMIVADSLRDLREYH